VLLENLLKDENDKARVTLQRGKKGNATGKDLLKSEVIIISLLFLQ